MDDLTKDEVKWIAEGSGISFFCGFTSASLGIVLKTWIGFAAVAGPAGGLFGVMSGIAFFIVCGFLDVVVVRTKNFYMAAFYALALLICIILCIVDLDTVVPYSKSRGIYFTSLYCKRNNNYQRDSTTCTEADAGRIILILIPIALGFSLLAAIISLGTTLYGLYQARLRTLAAASQPAIQVGTQPAAVIFQPHQQQPVAGYPQATITTQPQQQMGYPLLHVQPPHQQGTTDYPQPDYPQATYDPKAQQVNVGFTH